MARLLAQSRFAVKGEVSILIPGPWVVEMVTDRMYVPLAVAGLSHFLPAFAPATIGSRFSTLVNGHVLRGIPALPPRPMLPWGAGPLPLGAITSKTP